MVSVRQVATAGAITILVALFFAALMGFLADQWQRMGILPRFANPFTVVYSVVRALVLFIVIFVPLVGMVIFGFFADLWIELINPIINIGFDQMGFGKVLPEEKFVTEMLTGEDGLISTIEGLVETVFPEKIT